MAATNEITEDGIMSVAKRLIIGLSGKAGSGKDTVAQYWVDKEFGHNRIKTMSFADPLKAGAMAMFGLSLAQVHNPNRKEIVDDFWGMTPRYILQKLGTEVMRDQFGQNIWIKAVRRKIELTPCSFSIVVITDVRFKNEAEAIKEWGGFLVRVERRSAIPPLGSANPDHPSETDLDDWKGGWDGLIKNDGDFIDLKEMAEGNLSIIKGIHKDKNND